MFKNNDKTLILYRKIINIVLFIAMCACVIAGIVVMKQAQEFSGKYFEEVLLTLGLIILAAGPILIQFVWLKIDIKLNHILDVKIIRNAQFGLENPQLPAPIFHQGKTDSFNGTANKLSVYESLKNYKELLDVGAITDVEFAEIKKSILHQKEECVSNIIDKVKQLKVYADENILTEEEFNTEKSKILKK